MVKQGQYPFYVASSLCFLSAFLVWLLPEINQNTIAEEDIKFREYLELHGFDTSAMGQGEWREEPQSEHSDDAKVHSS